MIRPYSSSDRFPVAALLGRAYGRSYEPWLVEALRAGGDIQSEYVWIDQGAVQGHITLARHPQPDGWSIIATVAVAPDYRGQGIGSDLVRSALEAARQAGDGAITVLGNARYYQRFGFTRTAAEGLRTPFSDENTLMYPIRIENAGAELDLVYPAAYSRL